MVNGLQEHRQLSKSSCAASGMEAILKLHGLIAPGEFPYQTKFGDKNIGFEESHLLADHGLRARDDMLPVDDAIDSLVRETEAGRFPLVSLLAFSNGSPIGWHIYVARNSESDLQLIDPAPLGGAVYAANRDKVRLALEATVTTNPNRQEIHMLTYSDCPT